VEWNHPIPVPEDGGELGITRWIASKPTQLRASLSEDVQGLSEAGRMPPPALPGPLGQGAGGQGGRGSRQEMRCMSDDSASEEWLYQLSRTMRIRGTDYANPREITSFRSSDGVQCRTQHRGPAQCARGDQRPAVPQPDESSRPFVASTVTGECE
jgi:hypothetical protein